MAYKLYKVGVFLICFAAGAMVAALLCEFLKLRAVMVAVSVLGGVGVGIAGVMLTKPVIIACTSISGGLAMGVAFASLIHLPSIVGTIAGIIFAVLGLCFQLKREKDAPSTPNTPSV